MRRLSRVSGSGPPSKSVRLSDPSCSSVGKPGSSERPDALPLSPLKSPYVVAEEQEFRTDTLGAPERVLLGQSTDQPDEIRTGARPTPRLPSPEVPESL